MICIYWVIGGSLKLEDKCNIIAEGFRKVLSLTKPKGKIYKYFAFWFS